MDNETKEELIKQKINDDIIESEIISYDELMAMLVKLKKEPTYLSNKQIAIAMKYTMESEDISEIIEELQKEYK